MLIDYCCAPRGQLWSIAGPVAFYADLLFLISRSFVVLPPDCPGPVLPHSVQLGTELGPHLGTEALCHLAVTECLLPSGTAGSHLSSLNLLVIRSLLGSADNMRQVHGVCILAWYHRRLKPKVTWLSFPCFLLCI